MDNAATSTRGRVILAMAYAVPPVLALLLVGIVWEFWVRAADVPIYIVPPPTEVLKQLFW